MSGLCPGSNAEVFHPQPGASWPVHCAACGQVVQAAYVPSAAGGGRLYDHSPAPVPAVPGGQLDLFQETNRG